MERLEFLEKAQQIACQQVRDSSCLTDNEFKDIMESDDTEEIALYRKASKILINAAADGKNTLEEIIEFNN